MNRYSHSENLGDSHAKWGPQQIVQQFFGEKEKTSNKQNFLLQKENEATSEVFDAEWG